MKPKYEDKFIVINKKFMKNFPVHLQVAIFDILNEINKYIPDNKYYVCNQDEPYAKKIIDIILEGEKEKK
jgi:hypothetical protein